MGGANSHTSLIAVCGFSPRIEKVGKRDAGGGGKRRDEKDLMSL